MVANPVLADADIERLLAMPKPVADPDWRLHLRPSRTDGTSLRGRFDLGDLPSTSYLRGRLHVYSRQNINTSVPGDWSVGLIFTDLAEHTYRVVRCNGPHPSDHVNRIEGEVIVREPHVHILTERYQRMRRPSQDGYAYPTDAYATINQAIEHLATIANLHAEGRLFL